MCMLLLFWGTILRYSACCGICCGKSNIASIVYVRDIIKYHVLTHTYLVLRVSFECCHILVSLWAMYILFPHPAWPLVDSALLVSKRRSPAPDNLLTFVRPLCRLVGDPKPRGLQGITGFVVGVVRLLSLV